jgi:hypothetical protein
MKSVIPLNPPLEKWDVKNKHIPLFYKEGLGEINEKVFQNDT